MGMSVILCLLLGGISAQDPAAIPGVVVSPEKRLVFCTDQERRLVALKLETGKIAWTSPEAAWPLAILGGDLIVAVGDRDPHVFRLKAVGAADGKLRVLSRGIVLPSWARPLLSYDQHAGYEFGLRAQPLTGAKIAVYWSARQWDAGGIVRKPGTGGVTSAEQAGGLEFHAGSGNLVEIEPLLDDVDDNLSARRPDPADPAATIVSEMISHGPRSIYLSETSGGLKDRTRGLRMVCLADGRAVWTFSLGNRTLPAMKM